MSAIVYRISALLGQILSRVPLGTNLGLFHLLWALLSGRFLLSRGAVFPALWDLGLCPQAVRRSETALCYGRWNIGDLLVSWQDTLAQEGYFVVHRYEGIRPVAADLIGFFRPHLSGCVGKHYTSQADKALPAVVLGLAASVGSVKQTRLALPVLLLRQEPGDQAEPGLQRRLLQRMKGLLAPDEAAILDAGFEIEPVLDAKLPGFVVRGATNFTARKNSLPAYKGKGRHAQYGQIVRPLARKYRGKEIAGTPPEGTARWKDGRYHIKAHLYEDLVLCKALPGSASFRCVVIFDPRYKNPLVLLSNLRLSAYALWRLYKDRWPIEQVPLAAKQMLGAERAFVFNTECRYRLPELALLAGNVLSYVAAGSAPVASGFWDRCARPTCGRLRRTLLRLHFSDLPVPEGQIRKKASFTGHLPKGVSAHRRQKAGIPATKQPLAA